MIVRPMIEDLPELYEQQDANTTKVFATYTMPQSDWKWYILEYSSLQKLFYGYVEPENEFRYFTVDELEKLEFEHEVELEYTEILFPRSMKWI